MSWVSWVSWFSSFRSDSRVFIFIGFVRFVIVVSFFLRGIDIFLGLLVFTSSSGLTISLIFISFSVFSKVILSILLCSSLTYLVFLTRFITFLSSILII